MIYYIDTSEIFFDDCSAHFINSKNDEFITCGKITTPIVDEDDSNFINTTKEKYGINFFLDEQDCSTEIYTVPYINIFASDGSGVFSREKASFFKQLQRLVDQEPYCLAMLHLVE